ncbi:MAG: SDR family oxidoreductase [Gammaproteobacteria bacterium]|nr:SDR family oxidoreductase [Gammaproteobacteria bacterium]MBL4890365.1 SDR family oxidoreductase [Rhizobiaceae bacterium]
MNVSGKRILVTGATGGIGELLSTQLHSEGALLVLGGNQQDALDKLNAKLGGASTLACADIASYEGRQKIVETCQSVGGLDAVINLAGILNFDMFEKQAPQLIEKILSINLIAPVLLCHELIPILKKKPEATILNVGSIFASIGHPGFVAYCTSKAGLKCFTEALSRELADTSIKVLYIAPRATKTNLNADSVNELNAALGNKSDTAEYVANEIVQSIKNDRAVRYLGWPEKLFVVVNAVLPGLVRNSLVRKLNVIKRYTTVGESS